MEYLQRMKAIQNEILKYLDTNQDDIQSANHNKIFTLLNDQKNLHDNNELKSILYIISKITKNHYRGPLFFDKITLIINILKDEIQNSFTNEDIFNIFKKNKRMLLLLIDENIITVDSDTIPKLQIYEDYFYTEIEKSSPNKPQKKNLPENYEEMRRIGENESYVCNLIRNDKIEEFITYFTRNNISRTSKINHSIFETNSFLINKNPTLIEYALFFGSMQIVRFLFQNNAQIDPISWLYAIHGKNPELIHFLEDNHIIPNDKSYDECLKESIKCHNNDFAYYFKNNIMDQIEIQNRIQSNYFNNEYFYAFHFYNFNFMPDELDRQMYFLYAVENDYMKIIDYYINEKGLDINTDMIL